MQDDQSNFDKLYDTYSPMLYGIALDISMTKIGAEEVLIKTFQKISKLVTPLNGHSTICIMLIKLVIQTAHEHLDARQIRHNFKLKQFENLPVLHQLLCEQKSLDAYCGENKIARSEAVKMFRAEFTTIRKLKMKEPNTAKSKYGQEGVSKAEKQKQLHDFGNIYK